MVRSSVQTEQQNIHSVQVGIQKQFSVYLAYEAALGKRHFKGQSQRKFEILWFGQSERLHGGREVTLNGLFVQSTVVHTQLKYSILFRR